MIGSLAVAFTAGVLSVLSPCVLPILPIVLGAATTRTAGLVALAVGLATSFVVVGMFVATIAYSIGLDTDLFRYLVATLMVAIGVVLVLPQLQTQLAAASGPIAKWTDRHFGLPLGSKPSSQFWIGVLLGAVWSPCVGPTLGATSLLAAQGRNLPQVAVTMLVFGMGAAFPLLLLGALSREVVARWRNRLLATSQVSRVALGLLFVAIGALVLTGVDKSIEAALVAASPPWLTDLTTRF